MPSARNAQAARSADAADAFVRDPARPSIDVIHRPASASTPSYDRVRRSPGLPSGESSTWRGRRRAAVALVDSQAEVTLYVSATEGGDE
jgi:hypothetical protein